MRRTTIYLPEELRRRLERLAEAKGVTLASIIREALESYAGGKRRRRPRSVGLGRSGKSDLSERAEELLEGQGERR